MSKSINELIGEATKAVENVPDHLQEIAFSKAFDALVASQSNSTPSSVSNRPRNAKSSRPTKEKSIAVDSGHLDQLDRTGHPEINSGNSGLSNALRVLVAAREELGIDGLTASMVTHVLVDKFRIKISRQAVSKSLNDAGKYVDRKKEGGSVIFRIMSAGEEFLDSGEATEGKQPAAKKQSKKKKGTERPAKTVVPKKKTAKGARSSSNGKRSSGPAAALKTLIEQDFFSQPKVLADIVGQLKRKIGRSYKSSELQPILLRYLRNGTLSREKNPDNQYEYENA